MQQPSATYQQGYNAGHTLASERPQLRLESQLSHVSTSATQDHVAIHKLQEYQDGFLAGYAARQSETQ